MQAYSFTSAPIAKALVAAYQRGIKVEILLDKSHLTTQYTSGPFVAKAGIPTKIDPVHEITSAKSFLVWRKGRLKNWKKKKSPASKRSCLAT